MGAHGDLLETADMFKTIAEDAVIRYIQGCRAFLVLRLGSNTLNTVRLDNFVVAAVAVDGDWAVVKVEAVSVAVEISAAFVAEFCC